MHGRRPTIASMSGVVAAAHPLAAQAGARLLAQGGNAFDAAAATAAALNVVEPYMSGLAGQGLATCWLAAERRIKVLDFVPRVPLRFPVERFTTREELARGPLSVGVPGNLAGWAELVRTHGRKSLAEALAPAIGLAREGFPLVEFNVEEMNEHAPALKRYAAFHGEFARTYMGGGDRVEPGRVLKQPELARTLERIAADGPKVLYARSARPIHRRAPRDARRLHDHGRPRRVRSALEGADRRRLSRPLHTCAAAALRGLPIPADAAHPRRLRSRPPRAQRRRAPGHRLSRHPARGRRAHRQQQSWRRTSSRVCSPTTTWRSCAPACATAARSPDRPSSGSSRRRAAEDPGHTTSFSIGDREGNLVCVTQSLGSPFGSGVVVPGTGVCLNNFLYWSEVAPKSPNRTKPGAELAMCMSPSISTLDGRPVLALGTPGSYGILQTQVQALVQYLDFALPLQEAIEAPRARLWDGRHIQVEGRIPPATIAALKERGHGIEAFLPWTMKVGGMQAVAVDPATGVMTGAADPRRDSYAIAL